MANTTPPIDPNIPSKNVRTAKRVTNVAVDASVAGAIVMLLAIYKLIPAEAGPPVQVLIGAVFTFLREYTRPHERRSSNEKDYAPDSPDSNN